MIAFKKIKQYLISLSIAVFFLATTFSLYADESDPIRVKVAVLNNFPPQYSTSDAGEPQGFAIDIIEEIARLANLEIEYLVKNNWEEMFDALRTEQADLIPNQGITDRRKELFEFTRPVETFPVSIFTRVNEKAISTIQSLNAKNVAVVKLNIGEMIVKDYPEIIVQKYEHIEDALFGLLSGNSDALIYPEPVLWKLAMQARLEDKIKVVGDPIIEIRRAISVAKNNQVLLKRLDSAVGKLVGSEKYQIIYKRWYGSPTPFWTVEKIVAFMTSLLVIIIFGMAFWRYRSTMSLNNSLQKQIAKREIAEQKLKQANETLEKKVDERTRHLQDALEKVKTLRGLLPICMHCKKIRDDKGYWNQMEAYIHKHSDVEFSHSICSDCAKKYYPDMDLYND
ncbi:MAG: transporter substrate-binding domain-containing protein [Desulfobacteraceae bacterium]|nr:transporter substrate-binding domain-containing protein [Desulfobacteraceae bacterium]